MLLMMKHSKSERSRVIGGKYWWYWLIIPMSTSIVKDVTVEPGDVQEPRPTRWRPASRAFDASPHTPAPTASLDVPFSTNLDFPAYTFFTERIINCGSGPCKPTSESTAIDKH